MTLQELLRKAMNQISMNREWKEDYAVPRQVLEECSQGDKSENKLGREGESRLWVFPRSLGHLTVKAVRQNKETWKFNYV